MLVTIYANRRLVSDTSYGQLGYARVKLLRGLLWVVNKLFSELLEVRESSLLTDNFLYILYWVLGCKANIGHSAGLDSIVILGLTEERP